MGGFVQISAGSVGGGAANAGYITRTSAVEEKEALYHNAPKDVERAETWEDTRIRLRSWAEQVEAEEKARHGNRAGQPRTHYRGKISYEDDVEISVQEALEDTRRFLEEEFPEAKAVAVVHGDTDNTHVHIWMSARQVDESKVHIDNQQIRGMHETMDQIYQERTQRESRNAEKVEETRQFKRDYAKRLQEAREEARELGDEGASIEERAKAWRRAKKWAERNRPERANPPGPEVYREREERLHGKEVAEEVGAEAEARADDRRAEQVSKQKETIESVRQRLEQRERERHEPGHEGRPSRNQSGADRDHPASRRGERRADGAGEGRDRRDDRGRAGEAQEGDEPGKRRDRERSGRDKGSGCEAEIGGDLLGTDRDSTEHSGSGGGDVGSEEGGESDVDLPDPLGAGSGSDAGSSSLPGGEEGELDPPAGVPEALEALEEYGKGCDFAPYEEDFSSFEEKFRAMEEAEEMRKVHLSKLSEGELASRINNGIEHSALQDLRERDHIPSPEAGRVIDRLNEAAETTSQRDRDDAVREARSALRDVSESDRDWLREAIHSSWAKEIGLGRGGGQDKGRGESQDEGEDEGSSRGYGYDRGMGI